MNTSKLLVSSIAALSVVGAIGFANAQSTAPVAQPDSQARQLDQSTNTNNTLPGSSTDTMNNNNNNQVPMTTDSTLQRNADLPAQIDRN